MTQKIIFARNKQQMMATLHRIAGPPVRRGEGTEDIVVGRERERDTVEG